MGGGEWRRWGRELEGEDAKELTRENEIPEKPTYAPISSIV